MKLKVRRKIYRSQQIAIIDCVNATAEGVQGLM